MLKKVLALSALALASSFAMAKDKCTVDLAASDRITDGYILNGQIQIKKLVLDKSCQRYTINLRHIGQNLDKVHGGRNMVLVRDDKLRDSVVQSREGGIENNFLPAPGDSYGQSLIYGASGLIRGGESTSLTFDKSTIKGGKFRIICTMPGHYMFMQPLIELR